MPAASSARRRRSASCLARAHADAHARAPETPHRCFHPNVDAHGNICLDILKEKWSAAYSVKTILLSLQSLLAEPNVDSPLNVQAAGLWADQVEYRKALHQKYAAGTV